MAKAVVFNLGSRTIFEGPRVDILCTQLQYICFIQVLDEGRLITVGCYNGSPYRKENRESKQSQDENE